MKESVIKVYILYPFSDGPWGGANQFLKALRNQFETNNIYVDNIEDADVVLLNSINAYRGFKELYELRKKYPEKTFVHRVDGPVFLGRGHNKCIDKGVFLINTKLADATIYQSQWSKDQCLKAGMKNDKLSGIIKNSPNKEIFYPLKGDKYNNKVTIIATSWSNNWNKGFKYYKYLDEHLDFDKYDFIFVGNSPIKFENVTHYAPQDSKKLAETLRMSDIYLTACKNDACSNSLIEALCCGLPAVVLNHGGNPELIGEGGITFFDETSMMNAIEKMVENYNTYKSQIPVYDMQKTAEEYLDFFEKAIEQKEDQEYNSLLLPILMKYYYFEENAEAKFMELKRKIVKLKQFLSISK